MENLFKEEKGTGEKIIFIKLYEPSTYVSTNNFHIIEKNIIIL